MALEYQTLSILGIVQDVPSFPYHSSSRYTALVIVLVPPIGEESDSENDKEGAEESTEECEEYHMVPCLELMSLQR